MSQLGFQTQRKRILDAYAKEGQEVIAHTIPYHSTGVFRFDKLAVAAGTTPANSLALYQAAQNQQIQFFSYGLGEQVALGGSEVSQRATSAETNLAKGSSTNGAQDFIIEGVGFHCKGMRVQYNDTDVAIIDAYSSDPSFLSALRGNRVMYDPASILTPPQMMSPFNLENGLFQSLLTQSSLEFLFDQQRIEKVGTLDLLPQAGAQSYLRANGVPSSENRYKIPEGYLWRKDGLADSEMLATVTLQRPVFVPMNATVLPLTPTTYVSPDTIWLEVTMRLYGLAVNMPSAN